jgi:hypothetical protein
MSLLSFRHRSMASARTPPLSDRTELAPPNRYVSAHFHSKASVIWLGKCQAQRYKKIPGVGPLILLNIDYN